MERKPQSEIEKRIKRILRSALGVNSSIPSESTSTTPLLGRGIGLDSMETLTLVVGIEEEFDIQVADSNLTVSLFKDIGTLAQYVLSKIVDVRQKAGS